MRSRIAPTCATDAEVVTGRWASTFVDRGHPAREAPRRAAPPPTIRVVQSTSSSPPSSPRRLADASMDIGGPGRPAPRCGTEDAPMEGRSESTYRYTVIDTIGGGSSEIQKNIIARRGLGLPKNFCEST
ncbi:MAG: acyl-CoA dehydrogenase family protein [Acidimicrobiia bacterium]|nr:acyl-CoA dehydrogenase family protein [Acidimicrobiia bacterium]